MTVRMKSTVRKTTGSTTVTMETAVRIGTAETPVKMETRMQMIKTSGLTYNYCINFKYGIIRS